MRYTEPNQPGSPEAGLEETAEDRLRRENEELRRQLVELKGQAQAAPHVAGPPSKLWHPSGVTIGALFLGVTVLAAAAFLAGYLPLQKRRNLIREEALREEQALPRVEVVRVGRSSRNSQLELPGSMQAITEAPVLARASGYILRRMADIGDRVRSGQPLAEIDAPELDEQVRQAGASVQQAQAALDEALANHEQGRSDMEFARVTAERWSRLVARGAVSRQENDQYQTQYQSRVAAVRALEKAIAAQRGSLAAAEANLARLRELQSFKVVKAPFAGIITLRNVDVGALVNAGSTLLFRIAQTEVLRTYVNVPQANAGSVRAGQTARLRVSNLPGRSFTGTVARMANALDPASRTMLVEVRVPNAEGALLPGMYALVDLSSPRMDPPLLVPSDALIFRADGTRVALVGADHVVHLRQIDVGRDYGDRLEVLGGLKEGDLIISNPGDLAREGVAVNPVPKRAEK
ncbi:MAG TPA: efflux RND transporter periplasmic adaptor subunit [Bryobacteraceae bacterium]|nr:efflux RND transporter periplasmic adaptor subunit [Bryobacteraceae bacterium]